MLLTTRQAVRPRGAGDGALLRGMHSCWAAAVDIRTMHMVSLLPLLPAPPARFLRALRGLSRGEG
eukprot:8646913-Alexandrium_andersonii.AAC.1